MTEKEWLEGIHPRPMLDFLHDFQTERKCRLFMAACCRRLFPILADNRYRTVVEFAEGIADSEADPANWEAVCKCLPEVPEEPTAITLAKGAVVRLHFPRNQGAFHLTIQAIGNSLIAGLSISVRETELGIQSEHFGTEFYAIPVKEAEFQCELLRDIFGNPFRSTSIDPFWLTPNVATLAQAIYTDRTFGQMPVLADELNKGGCDNLDILDHCRGPGPHVKGCWVVDLVLGKG